VRLIGYQGAIAFDFYNSRFRRLPGDHPTSRGDGCSKSLSPQNATIETTGSLVA
jgi:hypothetical protein